MAAGDSLTTLVPVPVRAVWPALSESDPLPPQGVGTSRDLGVGRSPHVRPDFCGSAEISKSRVAQEAIPAVRDDPCIAPTWKDLLRLGRPLPPIAGGQDDQRDPLSVLVPGEQSAAMSRLILVRVHGGDQDICIVGHEDSDGWQLLEDGALLGFLCMKCVPRPACLREVLERLAASHSRLARGFEQLALRAEGVEVREDPACETSGVGTGVRDLTSSH